MKNSLLGILLPVTLAVVAIGSLALWTGRPWSERFEPRVPGMDGAPPPDTLGGVARAVIGMPVKSDGKPSALPGAWPWFRGPNLDGICDDGVPLADQWPAGGPEKLWTVELGEGYAAAAVSRGCVYVLDYVTDEEVEELRYRAQPQRVELADALGSVLPPEYEGIDRAELIDALRYESPLTPLSRLSQEQRNELADGLDALAADAIPELEGVLRRFFPEGTLPPEQYDSLRAAAESLLSQRRGEWIAALRYDPAKDEGPLPRLVRPSLDNVDRSADTLRCLSLDDGREIWRNSYRVIVGLNHGKSRTVPAVIGDHVVTLGPRCHVACWDATSGEGRWLLDLARDFGTEVPKWHAGQCPFVDAERDVLVLAPCGASLMIGVNYRTGDVVWKAENPDPKNWQMTHSSITPMEFGGRRMYVYCATGGVAGVSADPSPGLPPDQREVLWKTTDWTMDFATSPAPVILDGGRILLSSGYSSASVILQVKQDAERFSVETAVRLTRKQFGTEQQTPTLFEGYLYGIRKDDKRLVCLDQQGNEIWNSQADKFGRQYGFGPWLIADGLIFAMDDNGELTMAKATPEGYQRLARAQVIEDGHDSWGPMALVAGRLIVRDMTRMVCLDVAKKVGQGLP
ncbi:MAG TPA: PQQ-binding-like beta-propeller repeat protein [Thermoguttaceae bacterium]|nr:PQQ-binding-like beta-propeller repeat protein [Thermoguttaceae bacterium]HUT91852.1 PQQ-binding-like beta-propeller repeat protein [Thermoguttaceae bacterium]